MATKILFYILFYISAFLLGFFGIAPIILLGSLKEKAPYIILVTLGYLVIITLFVMWRRGKFGNIGKSVQGNKELEVKNIDDDMYTMEIEEEMVQNKDESSEEEKESVEEVEEVRNRNDKEQKKEGEHKSSEEQKKEEGELIEVEESVET